MAGHKQTWSVINHSSWQGTSDFTSPSFSNRHANHHKNGIGRHLLIRIWGKIFSKTLGRWRFKHTGGIFQYGMSWTETILCLQGDDGPFYMLSSEVLERRCGRAGEEHRHFQFQDYRIKQFLSYSCSIKKTRGRNTNSVFNETGDNCNPEPQSIYDHSEWVKAWQMNYGGRKSQLAKSNGINTT